MKNVAPEDRLPAWFSRLAGAVHRWEHLHGGSLEGFPETRRGIQRLMENGSENDDVLRNAPDFRLDFGTRFVLVSVEDEPTMRIWRLSAGKKSTKHHQVPRMLIRRWADEKGKVLWRRSQWEPGRVASMRPGKIMRRSNAYTLQCGLDPQVAEQHLAHLESVTAETLGQIDELVEATPEGHLVRWQDELLYAPEVLKLFILHQMIRTEDSRRGLERDFPLDDWVRTARSNATRWTDSDTDLMRHEYRNWLAFATAIVLPDHPWCRTAAGPATEIYIGLPDPPGDVFPLTDDPVWFPLPIPHTHSQTADTMRTDLGVVAPFLPISPRVGIGIKPAAIPDDTVKWALIPVDAIMQSCIGLSSCYSEVVLPWKSSRLWDIFGAR